jgi:hypothetical protein
VSVKDDVLSDFQEFYPGLTRDDVERLLTLLDQSSSTEGAMSLSVATALEPLVPDVSRRLGSYGQADADDYLRMLRGAVVLLLQEWPSDGQPPSPGSISERIDTLEDQE